MDLVRFLHRPDEYGTDRGMFADKLGPAWLDSRDSQIHMRRGSRC